MATCFTNPLPIAIVHITYNKDDKSDRKQQGLSHLFLSDNNSKDMEFIILPLTSNFFKSHKYRYIQRDYIHYSQSDTTPLNKLCFVTSQYPIPPASPTLKSSNILTIERLTDTVCQAIWLKSDISKDLKNTIFGFYELNVTLTTRELRKNHSVKKKCLFTTFLP